MKNERMKNLNNRFCISFKYIGLGRMNTKETDEGLTPAL